jgi:geranylgeranyl reductase family protein
MGTSRFDALVIGAGPAGSAAAIVLARGGARVALVDKATFPRDKACGDLVGPRGVQLLSDLGISVPDAVSGDNMVVVGPTGRRVRLPTYAGLTYPGHGISVPRMSFDATLREAALDAGAEAFVGRATQPLFGDGGLEGFALSGGQELRADWVLGADGATSRVASAADLVDPQHVLWGFALRAYMEERVETPHIAFWDPIPGHGFPGYGWLFPGPDGCSNLGLGLGMLSTRNAAAAVPRHMSAFVQYLRELGLTSTSVHTAPLGGWLKLGMVGTNPARGQVLLLGDAAGLVNPLQGEGIGAALSSGRAAAEAILTEPSHAARRYCEYLRVAHAPYMSVAAAMHASVLGRPRVISAVGRALTAPVVSGAIAGTWSLYWNDLLAGAKSRPALAVATTIARVSRLATSRSEPTKWLTNTLNTNERGVSPLHR